jgi:DNA-directed RNA polymerase subunit omega
MNPELTRQAAARVGDPNVLINLVSRRVRQLSNPGAPGSRPLLTDVATLGSADIALSEIIHDKMGWEVPEPPRPVEQATKKKSRKH